MSGMIRVFRAGLQDLNAAAPLFDAYRQFYQQAGNRAAAEAFLRQRLEAGESAIFLAADDAFAAEPLGFMQLYPLFSSVRLLRAWLLNDLFVDPRGRQRGIGTALLREAESFGRQSGARVLQLETGEENKTAQRLYEALGWVRVSGRFSYERPL
ncbi:MAG: GNAT family N-acetyltransferase [Deltaproteobacteria bacterium]|nr:GNAT family N-acetyltransferase [Deltaproteobacteria bacterium]